MLKDKQVDFSNNVLLTATAISDVIDTQATPNILKDIGAGAEELWLYVSVPVVLTSAGATTLTVTLESDTVAGLSSTPVVHLSTAVIPKATLVAGYEILKIALPRAFYQRFVGLRYTIATGPFTGGSINASLVGDTPAFRAYAINYVVA